MLTSTYLQITQVTISKIFTEQHQFIINFKVTRNDNESCIRIISVKQDHLPDDWKHETLS